MELTQILNIIYESLYLIVVFSGLLLFASFKGRQAAMNLILALYLALLLIIQFPYVDSMTNTDGAVGNATTNLLIFGAFTVAAHLFFARLMPEEFKEKVHESFGKKLLIALAGTILIMSFTFQVLPIPELISTNTPLKSVFASTDYFFFLLLTPLIILYII